MIRLLVVIIQANLILKSLLIAQVELIWIVMILLLVVIIRANLVLKVILKINDAWIQSVVVEFALVRLCGQME